MKIAGLLAPLAGAWVGINRLWFLPTDPPFESATTLALEPVAQGVVTLIRYTWSHDGAPQAGVILVPHAATTPEQDALTWIDSFHTGGTFTHFRGGLTDGGGLSVLGAYAAPEGPPWGWRITLEPDEGEAITLRMYNITPEGEEMLAVEAGYTRSSGS